MAANSDIEEVEVEDPFAEESRIWKKNVPYMYDSMVTHVVNWPSLTVQWLPYVIRPENSDHAIFRLLFGTHATDEQNHLIVAKVKMPLNDTQFDEDKFDPDRKEYGGFGAVTAKIDVEIRMNHDGEINRARYVPQYPHIIATKPPSSDVLLFDYTKHPSQPSDAQCHPQLRLQGHTQEGYGLSWNKVNAGHLLSASNDKSVCLWDVQGSSSSDTCMFAKRTFLKHTDIVEDVCWHDTHGEIFASVGDDKRLMIWDARNDAPAPCYNVEAHKTDVNCVSFNPHNEFILATGSADKTVAMWDLRNLDNPIHSFKGHTDGVLKIEWSPHHESVFASSGNERNVYIWDASKVNDAPISDDGPAELLFIHSGHKGNVLDFSWNMCQENTIASVGWDNSMHIWEMADRILAQ
uniref:CAF1C_H4-bd domain-containing protein n=1 Tax=Panagrellus redivivus TaxID=6233 RepID=A0A7E4WDP6_PANRE